MTLHVISSNSSGNAYLLKAEQETLLIEAGVHIGKIKKALGYDLSRVVGCLVTHSHGDHACSLVDVMNAGIPVYASIETLRERDASIHHRARPIEVGVKCSVGAFQVKAFSVNHDVKCLGFLIYHRECGLTLFLTDTYYCDYNFPGLNNIIVEANHCTEIMGVNGTPEFLKDRIVQSHMNLKTCKELLLANDLSQVNNVVLIHLSDANSDASRFRREIQNITGKTVHIAEPGLEVPFTKNPI